MYYNNMYFYVVLAAIWLHQSHHIKRLGNGCPTYRLFNTIIHVHVHASKWPDLPLFGTSVTLTINVNPTFSKLAECNIQ